MKRLDSFSNDNEMKRCRFLLLLPALILPFLTFLLWSVGWVGGSEAKANITQSGLNMQLPNAKLKEDKGWNKLSFYEQADKDSALHSVVVKNDPLFQQKKDSIYLSGENKSLRVYNPLPPDYEDSNEFKVTQKLAQLNAAINNKRTDHSPANDHRQSEQSQASFGTRDVDRLERMLQAVNRTDSSSDPETEQLNGMMDKILDIQHPERVKERTQQKSEKNKRQVFPVVNEQSGGDISLLEATIKSKQDKHNKVSELIKHNAFYSLNTDSSSEKHQNIIEAVIEETQTVVSGSVIKFALKNDVYVNGIAVPQGTFLYGTASLQNERLNISIAYIHYANNLLPVALSVYDMDGLPGIYIPGSINRDVANQTGSEAVGNFGISSFDPSLGAQAANASIAAAKALINKKVKQVKVTIKAGYSVLLKDENGK